MDQVQKFATDQNVTRFVSALQTEADPARRKSLQAMLLECGATRVRTLGSDDEFIVIADAA